MSLRLDSGGTMVTTFAKQEARPMPATTTWPCPLALPAHLRPAWAEGGPEQGSLCDPICAEHGTGPHPLCAVPGCSCSAMLCPDRGDGEPLCEGHWLDTK